MTAEQYLKEHGINEESIKRFHIDWDENQINIPIKNKEDKIIWTKHRNLNYNPDDPNSDKYLNDAGSKVSLFNIRSHHNAKNIVLCEGEFDAIRLDQEGIPSIAATAGAKTFNKELAQPLEGKNIYVVYDNDETGKKGIRNVLEYLPTAKILELPLDSSDICDFFNLHTKVDFITLLKSALTKEEWAIKYQPEAHTVLKIQQLYDQVFPDEEWLIDRIIPQTGIVMFVGEAGVGKSFLALDVARSMSDGENFINFYQVKTKGAVLIIDKENGLRRLQKRMLGLKIPSDANIYLLKYPEQFTLEKADFMQSISDFIIANEIKLVILDSFIDVLIGSENDSSDTQEVIGAIKSISPNICWLILHQDSKPMPKTQRTAGQKTRGSSNIIAQVDNQFYIEKTKIPTIINIEQGKSRDNEPAKKFQLEFINEDEQMVGFRYLGETKDDVKLIEEVMEFIHNYLEENSMTSREDLLNICESNNYTARTTGEALRILVKKGFIEGVKKPGFGNKLFYFLTKVDSGVDTSK